VIPNISRYFEKPSVSVTTATLSPVRPIHKGDQKSLPSPALVHPAYTNNSAEPVSVHDAGVQKSCFPIRQFKRTKSSSVPVSVCIVIRSIPENIPVPVSVLRHNRLKMEMLPVSVTEHTDSRNPSTVHRTFQTQIPSVNQPVTDLPIRIPIIR
jgi:hypothetical protein